MKVSYFVYENIDDLECVYEHLMRTTCLANFSIAETISFIGDLDDMSHSCRKLEGLERADALAKELLKRDLSDAELSRLYYCWANIWSDMRKLRLSCPEDDWKWDQEESEKEIVYQRMSLKYARGNEYNDDRIVDKFTNLGGHLNRVGRFFEALECWNEALKYDSNFGMAVGNRGYGVGYFSTLLFDPSHREDYVKHAYQDMKRAIGLELNPDLRADLEYYIGEVEQRYPKDYLEGEFDFREYPLGDSDDEIQYRKWCLNNKLFLNPMNDLFVHSVSAHDILHLPSMIVKTGQRPPWHCFVNQMKEEFVTARFLLYEGMHKADTHYSDKEVALVDSMDGSEYSINIEKVKMAFRMSYSLLDKIACFMNEYMQLGIPRRNVSLSRLWYTKCNKKNVLRNEFVKRSNLPFRGLFWLCKDFYEDTPHFRNAIEPDAQELSTIRNHLEHKSFQVINDYWGTSRNGLDRYDETDFLYRITRTDFSKRSLKLFKKVRAGLMYMLLGVSEEEKERTKEIDENKVLKMGATIIRDDRKI